MGGEGLQATEQAGLTNQTHRNTRRRRRLAAGCGCMAPCTPRRARSRTHLAKARGETADRAVSPDRVWGLPPVTKEEV